MTAQASCAAGCALQRRAASTAVLMAEQRGRRDTLRNRRALSTKTDGKSQKTIKQLGVSIERRPEK